VPNKNPIRLAFRPESGDAPAYGGSSQTDLVGWFRSKASLESEIMALRHQLNVLKRRSPKRLAFSNIDRLVFAGLYHFAPGIWERRQFDRMASHRISHFLAVEVALAWRPTKSAVGNPSTHPHHEFSEAIVGAPRIHGELLKLGIDIGQASVAKYIAKGRGPRSQGWKTFLHNQISGVAAIDLFVVPTLLVSHSGVPEGPDDHNTRRIRRRSAGRRR
jgi:hypothetical protein